MIRFVQTCDREHYSSLLQASSPTVIEYCRRFDCQYDVFVGLKRGNRPWHAALNRITMLADYLSQGFDGWAVYLDADAYIADLSFDLPAYLRNMNEYGFIGSPSGVLPFRWWDLNNGVFAVNFSHSIGRAIVSAWKARLDKFSDEALASEQAWSDVIDDQQEFHGVLLEVEDCERAVHVDREIFNWDNLFIRQVIREAGSVDHRERSIRKLVATVLGSVPDARERECAAAEMLYQNFMVGVYGAVLLRAPDDVGLQGSVGRLLTKSADPLEELQTCFRSSEFASGASTFLRTYLTPEALAITARELMGAAS